MKPSRTGIFLALVAIAFSLFSPPLWTTLAYGNCSILLYKDPSTIDGCSCVDNTCAGTHKKVYNGRYVCSPAPSSVVGQALCATQNEIVGVEYECFMDYDYYAITYCMSFNSACTFGLAGCGFMCAAPPWAQCYVCLTGSAACMAAFAGDCSTDCNMQKCYVDVDSEAPIVEQVFLHFLGGPCVGTS